MELRQYLDVLRRRWPLIAAIVVLTAILSIGLFVLRPTTYTAVARFSVRQDPTVITGTVYTYDRYYNWLGSEFLVDDYTLIVPSQAFGEEVVTQLKKANNWNPGLTAAAIGASLTADRKNRVLTVSVESRDANTAQAIIHAAGLALTEQTENKSGTPSLGPVSIQDNGMFALLDETPQAASNSGRQLANAAVTLIVGLAIALALAFLLEFLDNSLRDAADAERLLNLPVIGAIPASKR